jgi:phytoene dehydrogenase-like protein
MSRTAIIGGGLAGLACAHALQARGAEWTLFEASDAVGGRVRTDMVDGFRLDRGFQVYLTGYRAAGELLDYAALRLRQFHAGAMVFDGRRFVRVSNPLRHPIDALRGLASSPATAMDLARLAPVWANFTVRMKQDPECDKAWGWVLEMYAYTAAARAVGIFLVLRAPRTASVVPAVVVISTAAATTAPSSRGTVTANGLGFVAAASA